MEGILTNKIVKSEADIKREIEFWKERLDHSKQMTKTYKFLIKDCEEQLVNKEYFNKEKNNEAS